MGIFVGRILASEMGMLTFGGWPMLGEFWHAREGIPLPGIHIILPKFVKGWQMKT